MEYHIELYNSNEKKWEKINPREECLKFVSNKLHIIWGYYVDNCFRRSKPIVHFKWIFNIIKQAAWMGKEMWITKTLTKTKSNWNNNTNKDRQRPK